MAPWPSARRWGCCWSSVWACGAWASASCCWRRWGYSLAWKKTPAPLVHGERLPFLHVLGRVLPHGTGLALGSIGFGTIATFITLVLRQPHLAECGAVPEPVRRLFHRRTPAVRQPDQSHRRLPRGDCLPVSGDAGAAAAVAGAQPESGIGRGGADRFWLLAGVPGAGR